MSRDFIDIEINGQWLINDLGLTRVSEGSRYKWNLIPSLTDKTVQVPNGDGILYFGSNYNSRVLDVKLAYDNLTDTQFRALSEIFNGKEIKTIRFYERPYVKYKAKVTGTPSLDFVCFGSPRVYRGEGSIQFTIYDALGYCDEKYLDNYSSTTYTNKNDWSAASGLLSVKGDYDGIGASIKLWNPGVEEADFKAIYRGTLNQERNKYIIPDLTISITNHGNIELSQFEFDNATDAICINTKLHLIEQGTFSSDIFTPSGLVSNDHISNGDFFKIPQHINSSSHIYLTTKNDQIDYDCSKLEYNYKYF